MDWALHENRFRFEVRAERDECKRLFQHQARALQDRMVRRGHTDRTRHPAMTEWEKVERAAKQEHRSLHQARVLGWGKQKQLYYAHKPSA